VSPPRSRPVDGPQPPPGGADDAEFEVLREEVEVDEGRRLRRGIVSLLILIVLVGALVFAVPGLRDVEDRISDVDPRWIALAIVLEFASCAGYVLVFCGVFARVPRVLAARVALSQMAFGAVLPVGGAGGIAVGAWITKAKGGSLRRFMERSAVLFLLTSAVNAATLALAGLLVAAGVLPASHRILLGLVPGLIAVAGIAAFWSIPDVVDRLTFAAGPGRAAAWLRTSARVVCETRAELRHADWRLSGALAYLWCDIAVLWVCFRASGASIGVGAVTLGFLIGYLGNILPVPGGIGVLDGGLAGALVLYGASPVSAAAAVLLYHAIVLWIPTLLGTLAFLRLRATIDEPVTLRPERTRR
jgi:uncharacterized membrane protein YbhN (UPF0104 family)